MSGSEEAVTDVDDRLGALAVYDITAHEGHRGRSRMSMHAALRRISDVGTPTGVLERAGAALGETGLFAQVLVSIHRTHELVPRALWPVDEPIMDELRATPTKLAYPIFEAEIVSANRAGHVDATVSPQRCPRAMREVLGWTHYLAAPVSIDGTAVATVHARSERRPSDDDVLALDRFAAGLGRVLEIALLRKTLQEHHRELAGAARWLGQCVANGNDGRATAHTSQASSEILAPLTPREREVLALMSRGLTNPRIARELAISDGTAKYHVKNILRKLGAANRADAVSRFLRAQGTAA